ncbi:hypothetical protein [Natronolimnobius baerhuensis]|uniref:Uncharacterized protein n=1 Tax=Natronolimnobius baerhuensis TaxID=253108 RepID=A0A202E944_9EURY|nr:hypothetical protein [Natronolimnobius baerhuensis]OVE84803.1 hypothetical protein B2G88_10515 [Natronolimnobius baerhuensis]
MTEVENPTPPTHRVGWLLAQGVFLLWLASVLYLSYRVFVTGLSPAQQRAADRFPQEPMAALADPLVAVLCLSVVVGVGIVCSISYYGYRQWRGAQRRRLELEPDLEVEN